MIQITDKSKCCGCEACVQACPQRCVSFQQDDEGFFYPKVNKDDCIQCGLCERVCPVIHPFDEQKPQVVIAAINKDDGVRMNSSSGGVFTLLAEKVIKQGGVVFGVRFDSQWLAVFDYVESIEGLANFRGSKYVQARIGNSFKQCKYFLEQGRHVLFSGTQCQIAALHHFLRKQYENLLSVDFICHGVPSPKVWQHYLCENVPRGINTITKINFRDKRLGWNRFSFVLDYDDKRQIHTISSSFQDNLFMKAFLSNLILRPSCHTCPAKSGRSLADITIADFWKIELVNSQMSDDKGTSLVLIHTKNGDDALQREKLIWSTASFEDVLRFNRSFVSSHIPHAKRAAFFAAFNDNVNLDSLIIKCLRVPLKRRIKLMIKGRLSFCRAIIFYIKNIFKVD